MIYNEFVKSIFDQMSPEEEEMVTILRYENSDITMIEFRDSKGRLHRDGNKPARIASDTSKEYFVHGKRSRTDGPAVILIGNHKEWWIDGYKYMNEASFLKSKKSLKTKSSTEEMILTMNGKKYRLVPVEE
mgnify:CR=1 FL=1